jgi:hypothetical protein
MTAHEFICYKRNPEKLPFHHKEQFEKTVAWEKRSLAAKRGAETRRKKKIALDLANIS